jgi:signal transduction histidine kinase
MAQLNLPLSQDEPDAAADGEQMVKRIGESTRHHRAETTGALAPVHLNELVKDSIAFTEDYASATRDERGAHARFRKELGQDVPPVLASPSELREVFVNLLRNAVDAIEGEGEVVVRTRAEGPHGVVEVSDTGTGMSPEVQEKLFRPLFTTKGERGMGLGLATSYAIVRRHGGDIQVTSAPGAGTTFTVRLPLASE